MAGRAAQSELDRDRTKNEVSVVVLKSKHLGKEQDCVIVWLIHKNVTNESFAARM